MIKRSGAALVLAVLSTAALAASAQVLHFDPPHGGPPIAKVVLISGDGGVGTIEKHIAHRLADERIEVVTLDSRAYFKRDHSVKWIAAAVETLSRGHKAEPVVLLGYSFGADIIPLIWSELDQAARARFTNVALISPTHDASTVVDPTGRYDANTMSMVQLSAHAGHLPLRRMVCITGRQEVADGYSSCRDPVMTGARIIELDGGHDYGGRPDEVADIVADLVLHATK